jgi:hypothetical protein
MPSSIEGRTRFCVRLHDQPAKQAPQLPASAMTNPKVQDKRRDRAVT